MGVKTVGRLGVKKNTAPKQGKGGGEESFFSKGAPRQIIIELSSNLKWLVGPPDRLSGAGRTPSVEKMEFVYQHSQHLMCNKNF